MPEDNENTFETPAEKPLVLTEEQAAIWAAFNEFGLSLEDIRAAITERDTLQQQAREREAKERISQAADLLNFDTELLERELAHDNLTLEVEGEGARAKVYVKPEEGERVLLEDYAKKHWIKLMPVLRKSQAGGGTPRRHYQRTPSNDSASQSIKIRF